MKRRTLFAVALSGILLRASEVLGIEETKTSVPEPKAYMGEWVWRNIAEPVDATGYTRAIFTRAIFKCR